MFNPKTGRFLGTLSASILLPVSTFAGEAPTIPPEARVAIARIRSAALSNDFVTLRNSMPKTSRLYFGSTETGIDDVLAEWKRRPEYFLVHLANVLTVCSSMPMDKGSTVDCDGPSGEIFRARLRLVDGSWKMLYMISGD
jgi:hypothetical protein